METSLRLEVAECSAGLCGVEVARRVYRVTERPADGTMGEDQLMLWFTREAALACG